MKRWVTRGALTGGSLGTRWLVTANSVERLLSLKRSLAALDQEGNPTPAEVADLYAETLSARTDDHASTA